jgi:hypothetical protein
MTLKEIYAAWGRPWDLKPTTGVLVYRDEKGYIRQKGMTLTKAKFYALPYLEKAFYTAEYFKRKGA